jgi:hypothetical protein
MQSEAQDMQRMQSEAGLPQQETDDRAEFSNAVVDILQHLAAQEQGELAWVRRLRERAVATLNTEPQEQAATE